MLPVVGAMAVSVFCLPQSDAQASTYDVVNDFINAAPQIPQTAGALFTYGTETSLKTLGFRFYPIMA